MPTSGQINLTFWKKFETLVINIWPLRQLFVKYYQNLGGTRRDMADQMTNQAPAIELAGISKSFGPVQANKDIDLVVEKGTIHGIIGENGAVNPP